MPKSYLLLGGNLGDVIGNFDRAVALISSQIGRIICQSAIYKSEPWGYESSNWYYNMALEVDSNLNAIPLLDVTQSLEIEIGRTAKTSTNYSDRVIDIDILDLDGSIHQCHRLAIPHPRLHERKFALLPLADIAPNYIHPILRLNVSQMLLSVIDNSLIIKME